MKFEIREPSYYIKNNKVDMEVISMCSDVADYFCDRNYSEVIERFDVIPVVAPEEVLKKGLWKEEVMFSKSIGVISVFKHINYEKYMNGTVEERKRLTIKCVIEAAGMIKQKKGTKFDAKQFEKDLLEFVNYTKEEIDEV